MQPADHQARTKALDVSRSFIVKAPAGSGKTTLLVKRYLKLLSTVSHPEEVIAITFTRKAAGEMVDRVLGAIRQVNDSDQKITDQELIECAKLALKQNQTKNWQLLDNPSRIRIQTIDALSQNLVRQMPWSAGYGAAPGSVDDDVSQHYLAASRQALLSALSNSEFQLQAQNLLLALDNNFSRVVDLLVSMLARRDQWQQLLLAELSDADARQRLEQSWGYVVEQALVNCDQKLNAQLKQEILLCVRYAAENLASREPDSAIISLKDIDEFPATAVTQMSVWQALAGLLLTATGDLRKRVNINMGFPPATQGGDESKKLLFKSILEQLAGMGLEKELRLIRNLPEPGFGQQEWDLLSSLTQILKLSVAELMVIFQQQGVCDHIEMSTRANLALGESENPTDLALRLDYQIQHLLVDEFQDTSHTQIELLKRLTAGWQVDDGRSLFFVGDPMQSIYRFREADVGIFLQVFEHGFNALPLDKLELTENFRCSRVIVDWVNEKFATIFPLSDDQRSAAVKYTASTAYHLQPMPTTQVSVHTTDKLSEAAAVCELVESLLATADQDENIAVLVRSRKHLQDIVARLNTQAIHYQGIKLQKLGSRSCIQDISALTKALCHPGDRLSWLAILRAPWCGLDLVSLTLIANQANNKTIWQVITALDDDLQAQSIRRVKRLVKVIRPAMEQIGKRPLHDVVRQAWQALGGADTVAIDDQTNINTYLQLLGKIESAGRIKQLDQFEQAVNDLWSVTGTSDANLQLMTIHTAKGLEFDTVILPGLYKKPAVEDAKLLIWNEFTVAEQPVLLLSPIKINNQDNRRYDFVRSIEKNMQFEESKRLLYVACTRAIKQLHLFVSTTPDSNSLQSLMHNQIEDQLIQADVKQEENQINTKEPVIYQRLPSDYNAPALPAKIVNQQQLTGSDALVEYQWVGINAVHLGTLIHEIICKLAEQGTAAITAKVQSWRSRLLASGVEENHLDASMQRIQSAIDNMLEDTRAQWILSESHQQPQNEWKLTSQAESQLENCIIDRTFIDEQGVRWIIDYKTSSHEGGNIEAFLDSEQQRYQYQLEKYASILRLSENNPIKLGLYFPLLAAWREWDYAG